MNYTSHDLTDTIVALATPPGVGAIGVIRLSGSRSIEIADDVFFGKKLKDQPSHTAHFGTIRDGETILDEALVTIFKGTKSYTGEEVAEISCHGSDFILQKVIQLFVKKGARPAQPGEFTLRAFLNGKMDLSQAEAVADLIASNSAGAHSIAMNQMRGGISNEIAKLREELINFASLIELELDFGEEDVEFADRSDLKILVEKILKFTHSLLLSFDLGNAIKNGVTTVIAGRPNAGKSTLLNALLNEERAIVSDIAGTTRDTIEEVLNIQGVEFRLVDTAGIRDAQDQIEAIGVEKTMEKVSQASLLVYVFDVTELKPEEVKNDIEKLERDGMKILIVCNKMDYYPTFQPDSIRELVSDQTTVITISAKNGMNIPHLKEQLYASAISGELNVQSTLVSNSRHYAALQKTNEALEQVLVGLGSSISGDFLAMDIRRGLSHLGEITGQVDVEDLLGNIFSKFCIGK